MTSRLPLSSAPMWFARRLGMALGTAGIMLLPAVVVVAWLYAIPFPLITGCGILLYRTVPSPSGDKAVILFDDECSIAGGPVVQGSMARSLDDFLQERPESFFSAVDMEGSYIRVVWRDDTHLLIAMSEVHRRGKLEHRAGDVVIEYE